jgi:hypothetical protein
VTVKVLSATTNVTGWDPIGALMVENQLITKPKFSLSCSNTIGNITVGTITDSADELPVSWTAVLGADRYDLEWTYVDVSAIRNNGYVFPRDLSRVFTNNSSRVTITGNSYNIPLMYDDSGSFFIRVRPVQIGTGNRVKAAAWSSSASTAVYGRFDYIGHQRNLNWQSNISFAEEGKRKVVVQYFDGSLRSRQAVTKDNTTNTTVVSETYYDYQGRPAIQVLPTPSLSPMHLAIRLPRRNIRRTPRDASSGRAELDRNINWAAGTRPNISMGHRIKKNWTHCLVRR